MGSFIAKSDLFKTAVGWMDFKYIHKAYIDSIIKLAFGYRNLWDNNLRINLIWFCADMTIPLGVHYINN